MKQQYVVRTFPNLADNLRNKLEDGWYVVMVTPFLNSEGRTLCLEYVIERDDKKGAE